MEVLMVGIPVSYKGADLANRNIYRASSVKMTY